MDAVNAEEYKGGKQDEFFDFGCGNFQYEGNFVP